MFFYTYLDLSRSKWLLMSRQRMHHYCQSQMWCSHTGLSKHPGFHSLWQNEGHTTHTLGRGAGISKWVNDCLFTNLVGFLWGSVQSLLADLSLLKGCRFYRCVGCRHHTDGQNAAEDRDLSQTATDFWVSALTLTKLWSTSRSCYHLVNHTEDYITCGSCKG